MTIILLNKFYLYIMHVQDTGSGYLFGSNTIVYYNAS